MDVKVLFFGVLAEVTGTGCKHYNDVKTLDDLKARIEDEFPEIVQFSYRVALNTEIIDSAPALRTGDVVAFLPPFAGG